MSVQNGLRGCPGRPGIGTAGTPRQIAEMIAFEAQVIH
jgi:hypothetical protein